MPDSGLCDLDVAIVGAGAAGVGFGCVLHDLGLPPERYALLDRDAVGASFRRWPRETRFLSPSFTSNAFGSLDLNAVAMGTSPAYTLGCEHPTGQQYADYLDLIVEHYELPVRTGVEVVSVRPRKGGGFEIATGDANLTARFVVWATGEFQYPRLRPFPGAELCLHTALVESWKELPGDDFLVIGGYESGLDAACHLVRSGRHVRVLDKGKPWRTDDDDPSVSLSPWTRRRLKAARRTGRLELIGDAAVARVELVDGRYFVHSAAGDVWSSPAPPVLAAGFAGGLSRIEKRFDWHEAGYPLLTEQDESTVTPGLFVVGPQVRHENVIFCFIYKFRQRFAVVADAIARRMEIDVEPLDAYRKANMFLDDLTCCAEECQC